METSSNEKTYALFSTPANRKIIAQIEQTGAKIFQFASVKTKRINAGLENIKNTLFAFDWIIFPDVYAVDYFLEILEETEIDFFELDEIRILAMGEAVADRLRFSQLHADIIPHSIEIETVFAALLSYVGKDNLDGLNFLIPKEITFDSQLQKSLIESEANVSEITVYQALIDEKTKTPNLKALLKGGAVDEFIFTSVEDIISLNYHLFPETPVEILSGIKTSGINETTMQALRENNLRPTFFQIKRG
ncbi:MAG: uroporphyrinogen-III synthase [Pyrinomonadaceae bacterium]